MDYPNDFNIKSFPAGKTIALSRSVSIWISIVFFLIVVACGFILLTRHLKTNYPFLIAIDPFTEEWEAITYPGKEKEAVLPYQIIQEKMVRDFVTNWFTISGNSQINEARWRECDSTECTSSTQFNPDNIDCAISCKSDATVFEEFSKNVLPDYRTYADNSGKWTVERMLITPTTVKQNFGTWQVVVSIRPALSAPFKALVFINIEQDQNKYPATLGYYVKSFNSYRLKDE